MGTENAGLLDGPDGKARCFWHGNLPDYLHYHDHEWGRPVVDDRRLFEKICLEGFQSGLSWLTILRKRENFREAFAGFDFDKVAQFTDKDVERLLGNAGIIRHRGKIVSTINNAKRAREMVDEFGSLAAWFWKFEPGAGERPEIVDLAHLRANPTTAVSVRISKELKKRGWSFVGPTTVYA
ncbi:MAG: DNA-3-methyladenine glycosylase I, partial [Mesorhizobium sp.]